MKLGFRISFLLGFVWIGVVQLLIPAILKGVFGGFVVAHRADYIGSPDELERLIGQFYMQISHSIPSLFIPLLMVLLGWLGEVRMKQKIS